MGIKRPAPDANSYFDDDDDDNIKPVVRKATRAETTRSRAHDDDDDAPRAAAPAPAGDDDEDEEEPGRRDREAPRGGFRGRPPRRAVRNEDAEPENATAVPRQRGRTEDDFAAEDEEEFPPISSRIAAGWGAAKAMQAEGGDMNAEFKLSEEPTLIKFLADEPFAVYRQHFLKEKEGKKSYVCLGSGCPLCDDLGHTPDKKYAFSVCDLTAVTFGISQLVAGPKLLRILETHNGGKYGPLSRHYWEISRIGAGLKTDYGLSPVRERYLADDYGVDPAKIDKVVAKLKLFTADDIRQNTKAELRAIAAELDT